MEIVKSPHRGNLVDWAKDKPEVLVLSADLTGSCDADGFRDAYPNRFFSMGVAEENMLCFAAGLAREGYSPYVHTFAVFIYRQAFHQISVSIAYPNLPVRMVGFLPGLLTPGGMTHQATDDVGVLRVLPNMTILECGDATEVESVLDVAEAVDGPVYIRMLRGPVPRLFSQSAPLRLGEPRVLSEGDDMAIISSGVCTEEAMRVVAALEERGLSVGHLHISTLKPFNGDCVMDAIESARCGVITMENHTTIGGLGSAVAEAMAEHGTDRRLVRLGLQDTFSHGGGREYLMHEHGLDAMGLVGAVERMTGQSFGLRSEDLAGDAAPATAIRSKADAL